MKKLLTMIAVTVVITTLFTGCNTTGKVLASTSITVNEAMDGWMQWVKLGYATLEQEHKVKTAYERYQVAMSAASNAYAQAAINNTSQNRTVLQVARESLLASQNDLLALINLFKKGEVKQ